MYVCVYIYVCTEQQETVGFKATPHVPPRRNGNLQTSLVST